MAMSLEAELLAILHGLNLSWDKGFRNIQCELNFTLALQLILEGRNSLHPYALTIQKIQDFKLPDNLSLVNPCGSQNGESDETSPNNNKENLWTTKWAAIRMVTVMLAGFGVGFVYYGVQLNVENLNFNLYVSVAINALMEIPAVVIVGITVVGCLISNKSFSIKITRISRSIGCC